MPIKTINPANGQILNTYDTIDYISAENKINNSYICFQAWKETSFDDRAKILLNIADLLRQRLEKYAKLITTEMGKPITQAKAEVKKCAWVCEHYAQNSKEYLKDTVIKTDYSKSYVTHKPLGVIYGIMPWNFPFWQVFRFAAPTLMAGNSIVLKHAENCIGISLAIEELIKDAGAPDNLFTSLIIDHNVSEKIIANNQIAAVTLTGSERAGSMVGAQAGKSLKKVVLELGGSDPYIILDDADLAEAVEQCVISRLNNTGQVCIAAKRLIILDVVYDNFKKVLLDKIKSYKIGDPLDENNNLGPLAREDLRDNLKNQVKKSIAQGASCIFGGDFENYDNKLGFYFPVTVLENIDNNNLVYSEELFGPVFCLFKAKNIEHAIDMANDSKYGLAAAVFSKNINLAEDIAAKINTGTVFINNFVTSDPRLPFGGVKSSGYGRELGQAGILEFVNTKTIVVK